MTKECKQQFTLRITQANSTQLIVILYVDSMESLTINAQDVEEKKETFR